MTLTDFERKVIGEFTEENGAPAGFVAQFLGISTAKVTNIAKKLQAEGLLEDTGYAMKFNRRTGKWDWIDKPKTEGGMVSKPGASTVWRATLAGHAAVEHEPSPHVEWKSGNETQEDAMATRRTPRGAARYRVTVKSWDRHYGDGHVVFKHNFETKRSEEADAKAVEILEKAMADNKPQGRSAQAWAERVSHDGYPTTLISYDGSSGAWVLKTPRLTSVNEARRSDSRQPSARTLGAAKAAGEKYAYDQIAGDYFTDWIREQMIEASRMDPDTVLPLDTKAEALKIAKNMLQQLEWDMKRELRANDIERMGLIDNVTPDKLDSFFEGVEHALEGSRDWLADELLEIKNQMLAPDGEAWSYDDDSDESKRRRGVEAPRRSHGDKRRYKPGKSWRLRVVDRIVPAHGAHRVEFQDGFSIQVHSGHGRNDLLYAMKPSDMRHEGRSPGPESRREYQYAALQAVLGDRPADFVVDSDGDVRAHIKEGGASEARQHTVADFNTVGDLINHAVADLGATYIVWNSSGSSPAKLYFPLSDGTYEEARVWKKANYWHAQGPGARTIIRQLPKNVEPLAPRRSRR